MASEKIEIQRHYVMVSEREFWSYLSRECGEFVDFDLKPGFCARQRMFFYSAPHPPCLNVCSLDCFVNTILAVFVSQMTKQRFVSLRECGPLHNIYTHSSFSQRLEIPISQNVDQCLPTPIIQFAYIMFD